MIVNWLFPLNILNKGDNLLVNIAMNDMSWLWHITFDHLNFNSLELLHDLVHGLSLAKDPRSVCEACVLGKKTRQKFDQGKAQKASFPL